MLESTQPRQIGNDGGLLCDWWCLFRNMARFWLFLRQEQFCQLEVPDCIPVSVRPDCTVVDFALARYDEAKYIPGID